MLSLLALGLLAIQPLLFGTLPRADALFHLHRLAALERMVAQGHLYPRWLPELGFGYGFPLFNYYAPLSYLLALPWAALNVKAALLLDMAAAALFLGLALYLWGRDLFGVEAGVIAALLGLYAPYTLYDLYQRGALAELWGLGFLVLTFWAVQRAAQREDGPSLTLLAGSYAALLLAHNITALVGTPLLWGYALFCAWEQGGDRASRALHLVLALLLGMGLSAFFWLPAFAEKGYVQIQNLYTQPRFDFHNHFLTLHEILAPPHPVDPAQVNPPVPKTLGWLSLLLALLAWLPFGSSPSAKARNHRLLLTLLFLAAVGMTTALSRPLWEALPLLRFVQFPWRFLGEASVALAMLGGLGVAQHMERRRSRLLLPLLYLLLVLYALPWLFPDGQQVAGDLSPAALIRAEAETGGIGTTAAADYLPRWVKQMPPADSLLTDYKLHPDGAIPRIEEAQLPPGARLIEARWQPTAATFSLESPTDFQLVLRWFYFPGWQIEVDGDPVAPEPWGASGLLTFPFPAGEHRVVVRFGETPLRHLADLISLLALGGWLTLLALLPHREEAPALRPAPSLAAALHRSLLVALLLFALKCLYLDHADTPFAPRHFDGTRLHGVAVPLDYDFSGQMRLIGYDPPVQPLASDRDVAVALYWAAPRPPAANYSVGLYLRDAAGHLYGQDDHQNPAGYPTSRLDAEHYIRDEHILRPYVGTPPGRYQLEVSLYDQITGQTLGVADAAGHFLGHTATVAEVEVVRPTHFPPVESLPRPAPLSLPLGDGLRFLGGDALPTTMREGEQRTLVLYWQAERVPQEATTATLIWLNEEGEPIAARWWEPGGPDHPPTTWSRGEIVRDVVDVVAPVMPQAQGERLAGGRFTVEVRLLLTGKAGPIGEGARWGSLLLERPQRTQHLPTLDATCEATWPSLARLRGYRLDPPQPQVGQPFTLTLYWEALGTGDTFYTVFVHLMRDGKIVAQDDAPPVRGERPTTSWLRGEIIADPHPLLIPADEQAGCFILSVGFYNPATLERLHLLQGGEDHCECPQPLHVAP